LVAAEGGQAAYKRGPRIKKFIPGIIENDSSARLTAARRPKVEKKA